MASETQDPDISDDAWEQAVTLRDADAGAAGNSLVLRLDSFEGPLDVLLTLARVQKVDLAKISILALVEQYLAFISEARRLKLELAADYLVMAAWLAYLKSRLLLPKEEDAEEPSAEELALRLQLRLQRLEALREMGARLMVRDRLGRDVFARGAPEPLKTLKTASYDTTLYDLLRAFGGLNSRQSVTEIRIERRPVYSLEDALERLKGLIGETFSWAELKEFLPQSSETDRQTRKSAVASMFAASLELAKLGLADVQQMETFGPLYLKATLKEKSE